VNFKLNGKPCTKGTAAALNKLMPEEIDYAAIDVPLISELTGYLHKRVFHHSPHDVIHDETSVPVTFLRRETSCGLRPLVKQTR
jgi:hypothetical protein